MAMVRRPLVTVAVPVRRVASAKAGLEDKQAADAAVVAASQVVAVAIMAAAVLRVVAVVPVVAAVARLGVEPSPILHFPRATRGTGGSTSLGRLWIEVM